MKSVAKYPHQAFHSTDVKTAFRIASQTKLANLFLLDSPQTDVMFNPFYNSFESTSKPQFYGHFSILNPIHQLLTKKSFLNCRLVFNANDVYISPVCYKEKQLTHNVVPTWNYVAAQFKGIMKILPEEQLYTILCKQVEIFQSSVNSEWRLSDAPPEYVEKLKRRIFGVKVQVQDWKAHMKLAQKQRNQTEGVKNWSKKMESQKISITNWMDQFK